MNVPESVTIDAALASLSIRWPGGAIAQLPFAALRSACMCAQCRRLKLDGQAPSSLPDVKVLDARPWGYGLQLVFDDGHERGIFPWTYLEGMMRDARRKPEHEESGQP